MGEMNAMRLLRIPQPVLPLLLAFLLTPHHVASSPNPHPSEQAGFTFNELFARYDCAGPTCGYYGQLCCAAGQGCYTDVNTIVSCTPTAGGGGGGGATATGTGYWQYYTTTYTRTDLQTVTATMSTYIGGVGGATATGSAVCNYQLNESPCGPICCASNQYCFAQGQCAPAANSGSSGLYATPTAGATPTPGAPGHGTTTGGATTTTSATAAPTTTVPFIPPVATGANVTVTGAEATSGGGLSGGAIAGIVIGVLAALLILGFILFCCCLKGMIDGCLACFGIGRKKSRRTEVEEYERYSHHASGGQRRTWYGAPIRTSRPEPIKEKKSGNNMLAILGGLAGLWAILGLKRRHENKERREREDDYTEYSYSEDYYTSASSESSDRRDTRRDRSVSHAQRSVSRR